RTCLEVLEYFYPRAEGGVAERLAHHRLGAGMLDEAVDALLEAGRQNYAGLAMTKATYRLAILAERAMNELGAPADDPRWVSLWTVLGWGHIYDDQARATDYFDRAEAHAAPGHHALDLAEVARGRAFIASNLGELERSVEHQRQAYRHYESLGDTTGMFKCLTSLGTCKSYQGDDEAAFEFFELALERFGTDRELDSRWVCECLRGLGSAWKIRGQPEKAHLALEKALALAEGDAPEARMLIHTDLGELARVRGDYLQAERHFRTSWKSHRETGAPNQHLAALNLAIALILQERYEDAHYLAIEAQEGLEAQGPMGYIGVAYAVLLSCAAGLGEWDLWDRYYDSGRGPLEKTPIVEDDFGWATEYAADLARRAGQGERARRAYRLAAIQWEPLNKNHAERLRERSTLIPSP
ncbi:MAG: tetratricopeptide repeat protein, partial [Bradymonadaceae bacterium]